MDPAVLSPGHLVVDGHNDLLWEARKQVGYDFDLLDVGAGGTPTQTDLPRLARGGVGGQFWSVYVPTSFRGADAVTATLEQVDGVHRMVERYADRLALATTADEVEAAWRSGRIASLLGAEGGHSIDCSLGTLRMLHALGVRYLTLTHNDNTPWADSATDQPVLGGLSRFGVEVVREMNRLGMMVDLSHVAATTMRTALDATEAPVVFSHSSAQALCDHPRNVPDDVLARLAGNGGLCMVTFVPAFVNPDCAAWSLELVERCRARGISRTSPEAEALERDYRRDNPEPTATLEDVVAHCEHVRDVAGIDHVGLGGDYDGTPTLPLGLEDVTGYPRLLSALAERSWSDDDLSRLTSRNILRVMRDVEAAASRISAERGPSLASVEALDGPPPPGGGPHGAGAGGPGGRPGRPGRPVPASDSR